jgi:ATP/maltotriose-dependent transcriptional regulator MalT
MGRAIGPFFDSTYAPLMLASLCLAEGRDAEASRYLEEWEQLQRPREETHERRRVACVLAVRDLLAGQPELARARLAPLLGPGAVEQETAPVQVLLAWVHLAQGEIGEADDLAERAAARAREQGMQVPLVEALRVAALIAARQGHPAKADSMLQEGLSLARRLGYPYGEALVLQAAGEVQAQLGQPEVARERLAAARSLFRQLGARSDAERMAGLFSCW